MQPGRSAYNKILTFHKSLSLAKEPRNDSQYDIFLSFYVIYIFVLCIGVFVYFMFSSVNSVFLLMKKICGVSASVLPFLQEQYIYYVCMYYVFLSIKL